MRFRRVTRTSKKNSGLMTMITFEMIANEFGLHREASSYNDLFPWIDITPDLSVESIPESDVNGPRAVFIFVYDENDGIPSKQVNRAVWNLSLIHI